MHRKLVPHPFFNFGKKSFKNKMFWLRIIEKLAAKLRIWKKIWYNYIQSTILKLSWLFVWLEGLVKFLQCLGGQEKLVSCRLLVKDQYPGSYYMEEEMTFSLFTLDSIYNWRPISCKLLLESCQISSWSFSLFCQWNKSSSKAVIKTYYLEQKHFFKK